jgi:hypothetical protein
VEVYRHGENLLPQLFHELGMTLGFAVQAHALVL